LKIGGVYYSIWWSKVNRDVFETINEHLKRSFQNKIRDNIALAEAPAQGQDIFRYNAKSNGAEDYMALEIIKQKVNIVI
jgi:chromosome partitioning protein